MTPRRPIPWLIALAVGGTTLAQAPANSPAPTPVPTPHPAPPSAVSAAPTAAPAAEPAPDPMLAAMARVRFLLGRWEGEGKFRMGPGEPHPAHVTEWIHDKLGGRVVLLEGHGTAPGPDGGAPITVHEALGVLSYDPGAGAYLLRAFTREGRYVDADVEVGDQRLVWGFDTPNGRLRYTLTLDDAGRWHEAGEIDRGGTWAGFFEMTLSRVGDG